MNEQELQIHLIQLVHEYGAKRNRIEAAIRERHQAEETAIPSFNTDEDRIAWQKEHPPIDWFAEFRRQLEPVFDFYCTNKKRVYGGKNISSFGFPVKFNGIEHPVETGVEFKNKNRAEVYIQTATNFQDEYLFVVLRKAGQWKIDSYKYRRYGVEKWDNGIL